MYDYAATPVRVIDGDTVVLDIDLGFNITIRETCRMLGINAPELHAHDPLVREAALASKAALESALVPLLLAHTDKPYHADKYGRMLVTLYVGTVNVNQWMLDNGYAVPYDGS